MPFALGATRELAVYRLVQEALTNAVKHAGPRARVAVVLSWQPEALTVAVVDDGGEVPAPIPMPGTDAGLQGMRERVAAVGGTFSVAPVTAASRSGPASRGRRSQREDRGEHQGGAG